MSDIPEIARYRHNSPFIVTPVIVTTQLSSMTVIIVSVMEKYDEN